MQRTWVFFELGKGIAVVVLGFLYFAAVSYLTGFVAAHASYPTWEHDVIMSHAFGEFTILALGHDFLRYIIPALIAATLTSLFRPARWLIYSVLLIAPYVGYVLLLSWLYPMPAGTGLLAEPRWIIIYWVLSSVLLYGLPPAVLWVIYKNSKHRFKAAKLHIKQ